jgi:hypothetical protein
MAAVNHFPIVGAPPLQRSNSGEEGGGKSHGWSSERSSRTAHYTLARFT